MPCGGNSWEIQLKQPCEEESFILILCSLFHKIPQQNFRKSFLETILHAIANGKKIGQSITYRSEIICINLSFKKSGEIIDVAQCCTHPNNVNICWKKKAQTNNQAKGIVNLEMKYLHKSASTVHDLSPIISQQLNQSNV